MRGGVAMELIRKDFTIECRRNEGAPFIGRDGVGSVTIRGPTASDVLRALEARTCGSCQDLTPWSATVRFRSDGGMDIVAMYRRRSREIVDGDAARTPTFESLTFRGLVVDFVPPDDAHRTCRPKGESPANRRE